MSIKVPSLDQLRMANPPKIPNHMCVPTQKSSNRSRKCASKKPRKVFNDADVIDGPRNIKQVYDTKYRAKQRERPAGVHRGNFADQIVEVENMADTHPFVQHVGKTKNKVPTIILFTTEQLEDLKRCCCSGPNALTTVLGFDKTFNLGEVHVTVSAYRNIAVTRRDTGDHPRKLP